MKGFDLFHHHEWYPLARWGFTQPFYTLNGDTIFFTWCAMIILCIGALIARNYAEYPTTRIGYLVHYFITSFIDLTKQTLPHYEYIHLSFVTALFLFIFICNTILFFPSLEEPTKDINTTFALAIVAFLFVQWQTLRILGWLKYSLQYIKFPVSFIPISHNSLVIPFEFLARLLLNITVAIIALPLEIMGKLASIISLSFRLFGNIFGGSVIVGLWKYFISESILFQLIGIVTGINLVLLGFFGFFEGFIQAFVFAILTITYLSMGILHD